MLGMPGMPVMPTGNAALAPLAGVREPQLPRSQGCAAGGVEVPGTAMENAANPGDSMVNMREKWWFHEFNARKIHQQPYENAWNIYEFGDQYHEKPGLYNFMENPSRTDENHEASCHIHHNPIKIL